MNSHPTTSSEVEISSTIDNNDIGDYIFYDGLTSTNAEQWGKDEIDASVDVLSHAANCFLPLGACWPGCNQMKEKIRHLEHCMDRRTVGCAECNEPIEWMIFHARICTERTCDLPFCYAIKQAIKCYTPGSYHLFDLDHLVHRFIRRLQDLSPNKQTPEEEDGEAKAKGEKSDDEDDDVNWRRPGRIQNSEISSTSSD